MDSMETKRLHYVDLIKVISTIMIVMQHSISGCFEKMDIHSWQWIVIAVIFYASRIAVPIFVMLSGIGMLRRSRSITEVLKHNILQLLKVYVCWMLVFGCRDVAASIYGGNNSVRVLVNILIKSILFGHYHTWFVAMLIGLYLVTPFLFKIVQDRSLGWWFVALSFVFTCCLPWLDGLEWFSRANNVIRDVHMNFVVGYSLYYVLGYMLSDDRIKMKKISGLLTLVVFVLVAVANIYLSRSIEKPSHILFEEYSPFTVIISSGVLLLVKNMKFRNETINGSLIRMSKLGIGIYLIHPIFLFILSEINGLMCILYAIGIWCLSLAMTKIISLGKITSKLFLI